MATGYWCDVLDLDGPKGEAAFDAWWLENIPDRNPNLSANLVVGTPGLGQHWYVEPIGAGNPTKRLPAVDWRGIGGQVIAPPSMHRTGRAYYWLNDPVRSVVLPCPAELADLMRGVRRNGRERPAQPVRLLDPDRGDATKYGFGALRSACGRIAAAGEGSRNQVLNSEAFSVYRLVGGGEIAMAVADTWLAAAADAAGLPDREIERTLGSARKGLASPRSRRDAA